MVREYANLLVSNDVMIRMILSGSNLLDYAKLGINPDMDKQNGSFPKEKF